MPYTYVAYILSSPNCRLRVCNSTRGARDRDIFAVCTVVTAPSAVSTIFQSCFRTIAVDVVQPNRSSAGTVAVTNRLSAASEQTVVSMHKWSSPTHVNSATTLQIQEEHIRAHRDVLGHFYPNMTTLRSGPCCRRSVCLSYVCL